MPTKTLEVPQQRRRLKPHQRFGEALPPRVQPPAKFAHLTGDALKAALCADPERWTKARVALEAGRSVSTVGNWLDNYVKAVDGLHPWDDYTFIKPDYVGDVPTWAAGDVRAWLMRTKKMRRNGVFIPHKPKGRPRGVVERSRRPARGSDMDREAPQVLADYTLMTTPKENDGQGLTPKAAREALAAKYGCSVRAVIRRCQRGRDLAAGRPSSH